jgi:hypothetical protein
MTFFFSSVGGSGTLMRFMRSVNFTFSLRKFTATNSQQAGSGKEIVR